MIELIQNGETTCVTGAQRQNLIQDKDGNQICTIWVCNNNKCEVVYDTTSVIYYGGDDRCWECKVPQQYPRTPQLLTTRTDICSGITKVGDSFELTNVDQFCAGCTYQCWDSNTCNYCTMICNLFEIRGYAGLQSWRTAESLANAVYTYADTRKWYIVGCLGGYRRCIFGCIEYPNGAVYACNGRINNVTGNAMLQIGESVISDWNALIANPQSYTMCMFEDRINSYRSIYGGNAGSGNFTYANFVPDVGLCTCMKVAGTDCKVETLLSLLHCSVTGHRFAQSDDWFSSDRLLLGAGSAYAGSAHWSGYIGGI